MLAVDEVVVTGYRDSSNQSPTFGLDNMGLAPVTSNPSQMNQAAVASISAAQEQAYKEKKKFCENKAQKIADADAKSEQCKADADVAFSTNASNCTPITKASIAIGGQGSVNGDINKALAAFNIKVGALIGGNVSGTLEWNPSADCRLKLADVQASTKSQCVATAAKTKAALAACL